MTSVFDNLRRGDTARRPLRFLSGATYKRPSLSPATHKKMITDVQILGASDELRRAIDAMGATYAIVRVEVASIVVVMKREIFANCVWSGRLDFPRWAINASDFVCDSLTRAIRLFNSVAEGRYEICV